MRLEQQAGFESVADAAQTGSSRRTWLVAASGSVCAISAIALGVVLGLMLSGDAVDSRAAATDAAAPLPEPVTAAPAAVAEPDAPLPITAEDPESAAPPAEPLPPPPVAVPLVEPLPAALPEVVAEPLPQEDPRTALALEALRPQGFVVQAGSFLDPDNATRLAERLAAAATPAQVRPFRDANGRDWSIVSVGPFPDAAAATEAAGAIARRFGLDPLVRPVDGGP